MTASAPVRALALVCLAALPLAACVSGPANPSATRASELASLVSRSVACRAGAPSRSTLDGFIAATPEQLASARSTYVTVSEAETINQSVKPRACDAAERAEVREKMMRIRAGDFSAL